MILRYFICFLIGHRWIWDRIIPGDTVIYRRCSRCYAPHPSELEAYR